MRSRKVIEQLKFRVNTTPADIVAGECLYKSRCMEKVAIARTLMSLLNAKSDAELRVRVDAGHIKFNHDGYRWLADTPKIAEMNLKRYDRLAKTWPAARRARDPEGWMEAVLKAIPPHSYTVVAHKTSRIVKLSKERQAQINEARRDRAIAGNPDKVYKQPTLHQRVVGF